MKSQKYDITYTTKSGSVKHIIVKATNGSEALQNARYQCYTGKSFRNPKITDKTYTSPRQNGYQGSERQ